MPLLFGRLNMNEQDALTHEPMRPVGMLGMSIV